MSDPRPDPKPDPKPDPGRKHRKPGRNPWFNLAIWVVLGFVFWRATQGGGPSVFQNWPELSRVALGVSVAMALYSLIQGIRGRDV